MTTSIEKYPIDKIGSWPEKDAIDLIKPDIPGIEYILESLRRRPEPEGRGALIVGDHD
jgi:hypothetical protein